MKKYQNKKVSNMVYTEDHHIALGQAIKTENGEYALRVKKDSMYEVIPVHKLMTQIIHTADATT